MGYFRSMLVVPVVSALGELETRVMRAVWTAGHATVREVCAMLEGEADRAYTTIMTTMDRLHRKGLLSRSKEGLSWRYAPTLTSKQWEAARAESLAADLLRAHGEAGLAAFVEVAAGVDDAMLDRLDAMIAARRRRE